MTETTRIIFEKYQIRKNRKQKAAFRDFLKQVAEREQYSFSVEKGMFGARNVVVGDPKTAEVVFGAHYDTCAVLPFPNFITPKSFLIYLVYQILLVVLIVIPYTIALAVVLGITAFICMQFNLSTSIVTVVSELMWVALMALLLFGPANRHTANDNTSGVTTLLDLMQSLPQEKRQKAAFVFFDLEELGTLGSASFASKHKKEMKDKLLINFDCVSDGENILFSVRKKAKKYIPALQQSFGSNELCSVEILSRGVFYPSDQVNFPCGVGVAALKKSKIGGVLYMDRIHTKRDTVYRQENIEFLKNGSIELLDNIESKEKIL